LVVGAMGVATHAYADDAKATDSAEEIVITGQRASIQSAQAIKKNANAVVDSIVADDMGKLPDRSVTEALQRVPGVTISRFESLSDPEHQAAEGTGVAVRGMTQVRAELNGRDIFSASGGRSLSFEDVPAELMAGVDTYKSPSADMIEGGLGGTVNLRTRMPFDAAGQVASVTVKGNYGDAIKEANGEYSGLYSNRWTTGAGEFGALIDLSTSKLSNRSDNIYSRAYFPETIDGATQYTPRGIDWRRIDFHRQRDGQYAAFQWAPSDSLEVYFTAFHSKHDQTWDENAFFIDSGGAMATFTPSEATGSHWTYDKNGALVAGTITTANGIPFGTSTREAFAVSNTTDYSTGLKWSPDEHWTFKADLQYINAKSRGVDDTIGLVVYPPNETVSGLNTATPSIGIDSSYLQNYANYSMGQFMEIVSDNKADEWAGKFDAEYKLDDSIIKSVKAGMRFTDKSADNRSGNLWTAEYQPWQVGSSWQPYHSTSALPKISNPTDLTLFKFDNFFRGNANVPTAAYLVGQQWVSNHNLKATYTHFDPTGSSNCCGGPDWTAIDLSLPKNQNGQTEKTAAAYIMTNYGFDDLSMPIDGNFGVRVVETKNAAQGQLKFPTFALTDGTKPFYQPDQTYNANDTYTEVLPSFNLRMKVTNDIFIRLAASQAMWAPEFTQLGANIQLNAAHAANGGTGYDLSLTSNTNPYLKPMKANQFDLSAEWYFDEHGGMAHAGIFSKDVKDIFSNGHSQSAFDGNTYNASWLINAGTASINGLEVGFTKFFDFLPAPFDGLGIDSNYTYIDSSTKVPPSVAPTDTDGSTYGTLPYVGLSKNSYNVVAMYEKYDWSARLAYNWRSKYLLSVGPNGYSGTDPVTYNLPIYGDNYGQLDASIGYKFNDKVSVNFEASNLSKSVVRGIMDQNAAGNHYAFMYATDIRYAVSLRATF